MSEVETTSPVIVERTFSAPVEAVFNAWTKSDLITQWWGAKDWTSPKAEIDLQVGGKYIFSMAHEEYGTIYSSGTFQEVEKNKRIAFTDSFADKDGNVVSPTVYGMDESFPVELIIEVDFEDLGDNTTKMTLTHIGMPASEDAELTAEGWGEAFDKLDAALSEVQK